MREAVGYAWDGMNNTESADFVWPPPPREVGIASKWLDGWKERNRQSTSSQAVANNANSTGNQVSKPPLNEHSLFDPSLYMQTATRANTNKRPAQESVEDAPATHKRRRSSTSPLLEFHVDYLVTLLKDKPDVAQSVTLLQHALKIVNAGADLKIVQWHLRRIQKALPNDEEVLEAADMLVECIKFRDSC